MSTPGTYPTLGIARLGHFGGIHDCRVGYLRMGYTDWDLTEPFSKKNIPYSKKTSYGGKKWDYVNSPKRID